MMMIIIIIIIIIIIQFTSCRNPVLVTIRSPYNVRYV